MHSAGYPGRSLRHGLSPPLFTASSEDSCVPIHCETRLNGVLKYSGTIPDGNASRKFNLFALGLKGDDVIKDMTWANCFLFLSI